MTRFEFESNKPGSSQRIATSTTWTNTEISSVLPRFAGISSSGVDSRSIGAHYSHREFWDDNLNPKGTGPGLCYLDRLAICSLILMANSRARKPSSPLTIGLVRVRTQWTNDSSSSLSGSATGGSSLRSVTRPMRNETIDPDCDAESTEM